MSSTYTKARLTYALKVFREARESTKPATNNVQRHLRNDYQFRQVNATSCLLHSITWDDDGASSDEYNPEVPKKRRPVTPRTPKPKRSKQGLQLANPTHTTHDKIDIGPFPSLVTIQLKSFHGRVILNALSSQHGTGYETKDSEEDDESLEGSCSRRRSRKTFMEKQDEESGKIDEGTTRSGLRRKIQAPMMIQGCSACRQANKRCSAKVSGKLPCKRCESEYLKCVEHEPFQDPSTKPQDSLTLILTPSRAQQTAIPTPSPTPTLSATSVRPIDELRRHFLEIQAMRGVPVGLPGISRQNPITLDSPSPSPEPPTPKTPSTTLIHTPWAHPIEFKSKSTECHFCQDFRYGIFGYGLLRVAVSRTADGQFQEEADGHLLKGKAATRMCVICALRRLCILRCKNHAVNQFCNPDKARINKYMQQLLDRQYPGGPAIKSGVYYTCSLCAQPAFWRCVANQSYDLRRSRLSEDQGKGKGCGLLLCKSCAEQLQADNGCMKKTTVLKDNGHNCRRADMEFLFAGSLLHRAYQ